MLFKSIDCTSYSQNCYLFITCKKVYDNVHIILLRLFFIHNSLQQREMLQYSFYVHIYIVLYIISPTLKIIVDKFHDQHYMNDAEI